MTSLTLALIGMVLLFLYGLAYLAFRVWEVRRAPRSAIESMFGRIGRGDPVEGR